ncbi:MAG TPA: hypothetical protein VIY96_11435 [Thermoanaerobaculia bacterium]
MPSRPRALILLAVCLFSGACRREKTGKAVATVSRAAAKAEAALRPDFVPPADRLLTDRHLDLYVRVRRAARDRSESDAARALGVDPDEFAWVRARIIEALVALDESRVRQAASETYGRTIASLRQTLKSVRDPQTARAVEGAIAGLERERAGIRGPDPQPPDITANSRKVTGRRAELESAGK